MAAPMLCHALLQQGAAAGAVARLWCPPSLFTIHMQFEFGLAQTPAACRVTSSTARHAWTMLAASCWAFGTTPTAAGTAAGWLHHRWAAGGRWVAPAAAQVSLCCCHGSFEVWLSCSCSRAGHYMYCAMLATPPSRRPCPATPNPLSAGAALPGRLHRCLRCQARARRVPLRWPRVPPLLPGKRPVLQRGPGVAAAARGAAAAAGA